MAEGTVSVWQHEHPITVPPWTGGTMAVDIAIVGGGLTAAWTAYHLSRLAAGRASVVVLAKSAPADGASGRNAGFVLGGTSDLYALLVERLGRPAARELLHLSQRNRGWVREVLGPDREAVGDGETGSVYLGAPDEGQAVADTVRWMVEDGVAAEELPLVELPASLRGLGLPHAAFFPGDGVVQPAALVDRLVRTTTAAGVRWFGSAPVTQWTVDDGALTLAVGTGAVTARRVVLATNAWLGELVPDLVGIVRPTRGQVLSTGPAPVPYPYPVYADHGYLYWRPRPDGTLVVGGYRHRDMDREWTDAAELNPVIQEDLTQLAERLAGSPVVVVHRWAGIMAFTPDHLPVVGEVAPGLFVAGGYSGHGVALTAAVAERLARHLLLHEPLPQSLRWDRSFGAGQAPA
jgi:gamma-glutamylputrescine oxidase